MSGVAGSDITGDMSQTLAKLRSDNALENVVHDPEEDAPHVVGIPRRYAEPAPEPSLAPTRAATPQPRVPLWRRILNRPRPL